MSHNILKKFVVAALLIKNNNKQHLFVKRRHHHHPPLIESRTYSSSSSTGKVIKENQKILAADAKMMKISFQKPLDDYKKLMQQLLNNNGGDEATIKMFKEIAEETRKTAWKLLFEPSVSDAETKASELLVEHKMDACFYSPWEYNEWIVKFRDELLKREMLDFWRNEVVAKSLGPCWARDSDFFDDTDDPEPANFYKHAGCTAPWQQTSEGGGGVATRATGPELPEHLVAGSVDATSSEEKIDFSKATISLETPKADFKKLISQYTNQPFTSDQDNERDINYIFKIARDTVWELLFADPQPASEERQIKAADLLEEYKVEACFYNPTDYNNWIPKVRDLVLEKKLLNFWRDHMVKRELGPCWARDSDYFDDMTDPRPAEFYRHAGCVAVFTPERDDDDDEEEKQNATNEVEAKKQK